jgi:hypothetical protein
MTSSKKKSDLNKILLLRKLCTKCLNSQEAI